MVIKLEVYKAEVCIVTISGERAASGGMRRTDQSAVTVQLVMMNSSQPGGVVRQTAYNETERGLKIPTKKGKGS